MRTDERVADRRVELELREVLGSDGPAIDWEQVVARGAECAADGTRRRERRARLAWAALLLVGLGITAAVGWIGQGGRAAGGTPDDRRPAGAEANGSNVERPGPGQEPDRPVAVRGDGSGELARVDVATRVLSIQNVVDGDLRDLSRLRELRSLTLMGGFVGVDPATSERRLTDASFDEIARLPKLERLQIALCERVTGDGIAKLAGLPMLRTVDVFGAAVDVGFVRALRSLPAWNASAFHSSTITPVALEELGRARGLRALSFRSVGTSATTGWEQLFAGDELQAGLERLALDGCGLLPDALAERLVACRALVSLHLGPDEVLRVGDLGDLRALAALRELRLHAGALTPGQLAPVGRLRLDELALEGGVREAALAVVGGIAWKRLDLGRVVGLDDEAVLRALGGDPLRGEIVLPSGAVRRVE